MPLSDGYLQRLEEDLALERANLRPLEEGWMTLGERKPGGQWTDTTQREIARSKRTIETYETMIARERDKG